MPFKHALIFCPNLHAKSEKTVADPGGDKIGHPIPFPPPPFGGFKKGKTRMKKAKEEQK